MSRFKTELCNNLIELGSCKYGERCHYAHGAHELRQVTRRHPKYRTERCKNFELTGKCPFGPRCSYVHPKPDLESLVEQLTRYVHHTKAPKPDSEDDDEDENMVSLFPRTATSASLYSNSDSMTSNLSNCNPFQMDGEANKENQSVITYKDGSNPYGRKQAVFSQKNPEIDRTNGRFTNENQETRALQARPLTTLKNHQNLQNSSADFRQQGAQLANNSKVIARPQANVLISSSFTNEPSSFLNKLQPSLARGNNDFVSPPPPPQFSSPPCSPSPRSNCSINPFGVNNPMSGYFSNITFESSDAGVSSQVPNKQYFTRF